MTSRREKTMDLGGLDVIVRSLTVGPTKASPYNITTVPTAGTVNQVSSIGAVTYGTVGASTITAEETSVGSEHTTKLTLTNFAVGTSGDNASLAFGAKIYTWPAGHIIVNKASLVGGLTAAISVTTDTPEVGLGTVVATGAAATLTTATWENIMDGGATGSATDGVGVAPDVAGTLFGKSSLSTISPFIKASGGAARDVFLTVADGWADVAAAGAVTFTGTIILNWTKVT